MSSVSDSVLIVIPTYNERENIPILVPQLRDVVPDAHLLIVDDASPDGTGFLADELAAADDHVHVLHRTSKDGLGRAYVAGFAWGLARGFDLLAQMDADLSHDPNTVPALIAAVDRDCDAALGSRYVPGGRTRNWCPLRRTLSRFGSIYARTILGLDLKDLTGGFKCWRRQVLADIDLASIRSNGYSFQIEMTHRAVQRGCRVAEVPIIFTDRIGGCSKMSQEIIWEAAVLVWRLRWGVPAWPAVSPWRDDGVAAQTAVADKGLAR